MPDCENPQDDKEKDIRALQQVHRLGRQSGAARGQLRPPRAPRAVKGTRKHGMADWSQASRSHVSHMHSGDFYHGSVDDARPRARREDGG